MDGASLSEGQGEDGELRQGTDLVWEQEATLRPGRSWRAASQMARTLTTLLLLEFSGNREPLGQGGPRPNPGKGQLGRQPWAPGLLSPGSEGRTEVLGADMDPWA